MVTQRDDDFCGRLRAAEVVGACAGARRRGTGETVPVLPTSAAKPAEKTGRHTGRTGEKIGRRCPRPAGGETCHRTQKTGDAQKPTETQAVIETKFGKIVLRFQTSPPPREEFYRTGTQGFYDGTTFHRVIQP